MMSDIKTREGMEFWDKICSLKHYGFIHSPDNSRVLKAEGIGNWIDKYEAQEIVDQAQDRINELKAELVSVKENGRHWHESSNKAIDSMTLVANQRDALQLRLNAADQRVDDIERALGGMLFAFDDGVGRDWSADLLDYARTLTSAAEFNPTESGAGERNHGIPGTSGMRLNMLANQGE